MSVTKFSIDSLCNVCLSTDRKLRIIRDLPGIMEWEIVGLNIEKGVVCWECEAIMKKYILFKKKAKKAQTLLCTRDLKKPLKCLSALCKGYNTNDTSVTESTSEVTEVKTELVSDIDINLVKIETGIENTDLVSKKTNEDEIEIDNGEENEVEKIFVVEREIQPIDETDYSYKDRKCLYKTNFTIQPISLEELQHMRERDRRFNKFQKATSKCLSCVLVFFKQNELDEHNDAFHNSTVGELECDVCNCRFNTKESLNKHLLQHLKQYCCNLCPFRHYNVANMEEHMRRNHDEEVYKCRKCDKVFSSKRSQKNHLYTDHGDPCACDVCGKIMKSRINLRRHVRMAHEQDIEVDCEICKIKLRGRKRLQYHMLSHSERERELSYCAECDIQFTNRYKYRIHLKGNKHILPESECPHCKRKFTSLKYVQRHIAIVHLNQLDYSCDICDKKFSTSGNLKIHLETRHEGKTADKKHVCTICMKTFTTKHGLQGHLNSHTGERPFKCEHCNKSFSQNGGLYKHKQRVHKVSRLRDTVKILNETLIKNKI